MHVPLSPASLCPGVHPALLCLVSTIAGPCISCLPMGRLRRVGSRLGTLGLCPHPVSPSCPVVLGSAVCLLFGCCSRRGVRKVTPHGPPDSALLGLLQDGVLKSQVSQPALVAYHHWVIPVSERGRLWNWTLAPGTVVPCPFRWDAGLSVTLTLLPVGPGLGQSFCFSLPVKGEPGNPLSFPGSRPQ